MQLYKPVKSTRKTKKYMVLVRDGSASRVIHFGDSCYQQFRDRLGMYAHLDHGDEKRRAAYYKRHGRTKNEDSAKWWSHHAFMVILYRLYIRPQSL